jgi:small subunit ribosomal protein S16
VSVRIRLTRAGRKKIPHYRIVVMDSRTRRDGSYLDQIGVYHPLRQPAQVEVNEDKALRWLAEGAIPSETVRSLFARRGIMLRHFLTSQKMPSEKIEQELAKWREKADARDVLRRDRKKKKGSAKTAAPETAPAAPSA